MGRYENASYSSDEPPEMSERELLEWAASFSPRAEENFAGFEQRRSRRTGRPRTPRMAGCDFRKARRQTARSIAKGGGRKGSARAVPATRRSEMDRGRSSSAAKGNAWRRRVDRKGRRWWGRQWRNWEWSTRTIEPRTLGPVKTSACRRASQSRVVGVTQQFGVGHCHECRKGTLPNGCLPSRPIHHQADCGGRRSQATGRCITRQPL